MRSEETQKWLDVDDEALAIAAKTIAEQRLDIERLGKRNDELSEYLKKQTSEVYRLSELLRPFHGLEAVVRYRRKEGSGGPWNMAAFDVKSIAENYAKECSGPERPWEYWVEEIKKNEDH